MTHNTRTTHSTPRGQTLTRILCATLLAVCASGGATAFAASEYANSPSVPTNPPSGKASANQAFLEKAYECSTEETHVSRVVAKRSTNTDVRDFAGQVASAHSSIDSDITKLANTKGIALKNRDDDNTKLMEKWSKKDDKDLNEEYVDDMVDMHKDAVDLFEKAATDTDLDPALSEYARKTLPTLQKHLARAKQLDQALN